MSGIARLLISAFSQRRCRRRQHHHRRHHQTSILSLFIALINPSVFYWLYRFSRILSTFSWATLCLLISLPISSHQIFFLIFFYLPPPRRMLCDQVCLSFVLSFCLYVCRIAAKVISRFHWNLVLWLGLPVEELINFWRWSGAGYGFRIIFPLTSPLRNREF